MSWTPEREALLIKLDRERASRTEIATVLGTSRGAISGKLHRLSFAPKKEKPKAIMVVPALGAKMTEIQISPEEEVAISPAEEEAFDRNVQACREHLEDLRRVYVKPMPVESEGRYLPSALPPLSVFAERASLLGSPGEICAAHGGKAVDKDWR